VFKQIIQLYNQLFNDNTIEIFSNDTVGAIVSRNKNEVEILVRRAARIFYEYNSADLRIPAKTDVPASSSLKLRTRLKQCSSVAYASAESTAREKER